ncbi:MAG: hypothetical protein M3247_07635 [Thermoproteota archaeon]|nr:hypothetical protein [Thermoproteota archaeon]
MTTPESYLLIAIIAVGIDGSGSNRNSYYSNTTQLQQQQEPSQLPLNMHRLGVLTSSCFFVRAIPLALRL